MHAKVLNLFRKLLVQRPKPLGVCCDCGREIFKGDDLVTVVAAEYDRLRAHRECHFYHRSQYEWPTPSSRDL